MSTEKEQLAREFSDKARKVKWVGNKALVPHKFTPKGDVVSQENFNVKTCLSRLNLNDLRFLQLWRENKWNDEQALAKSGLEPDQATKTLKRLAYFKTEDARIKALATEATPERILAKDMENVEAGGTLNDSQHKSLDRAAKIVGAFKTTEINIQQNFLQMPSLTPEQEKEVRQIFDTIATEETAA